MKEERKESKKEGKDYIAKEAKRKEGTKVKKKIRMDVTNKWEQKGRRKACCRNGTYYYCEFAITKIRQMMLPKNMVQHTALEAQRSQKWGYCSKP